ncbi:MAG: KAP family NTPase [Eubacterium sp.]|nr:KAP family NTPase [Eubacterium sp.]
MWRDSETEIDYLDYGYIVDIMTDTINDEKLLPSCIGLYGDWGSGKSSLMHMLRGRPAGTYPRSW